MHMLYNMLIYLLICSWTYTPARSVQILSLIPQLMKILHCRVSTGNSNSELTRTLPEENSAEMMARIEAVEEEVRQIKERLDDFEASVPYLGTRKSVLNTLVFLTWLILPVGILYLLTPRRRG